jgi:uncharacterized RDD family membrane protein YckC
MSQYPGPGFEPPKSGDGPPPSHPHPLDQMWYVQSDGKALGPYSGHAIKDLIDTGSIGRAAAVAKVGAAEWVELGQEPALAHLLGDALGSTPTVKPATAPTYVYAGFWIRFLAYVIDYVILAVAAIVIGVIFVFATLGADDDSEIWIEFAELIALTLVSVFYYVYFPSQRWQATPGKRACGIYIVRTDGERVTGWLAFGRFLAYIVSSIPLWLGFFMIGWTDQKKGLHDIICGTRVVYGKLGAAS